MESNASFKIQIVLKMFSNFSSCQKQLEKYLRHVYTTKIECCNQARKWAFWPLPASKLTLPRIAGVTKFYMSQTIRFSVLLECFQNCLWTLKSSCGYPKYSSDSGISNAPTLVSVQRLKIGLKAKKNNLYLFGQKDTNY